MESAEKLILSENSSCLSRGDFAVLLGLEEASGRKQEAKALSVTWFWGHCAGGESKSAEGTAPLTLHRPLPAPGRDTWAS